MAAGAPPEEVLNVSGISFKILVSCSQLSTMVEQRISIVEFYFAIKSHCHVTNAFQQICPGETAPNASTITLLVQRFRDTGSVADRKRSGRASIVKTKMVDMETVLQRSPLKRPSVYVNIITEFIYLLKVMKDTLDCSKTAQRVIHHGAVWKF
ncbi:DUF4817 domain-containing protein [Trichonephila clavipes]|nr:DUF4817 domain-containing protein [Trichonephila clavipes]